jgi:hypothetical protein
VSRISVFIFGRAHDDAEVLRVGAAIEKVMNVKERLVPYMLPETDLSSVMGS